MDTQTTFGNAEKESYKEGKPVSQSSGMPSLPNPEWHTKKNLARSVAYGKNPGASQSKIVNRLLRKGAKIKNHDGTKIKLTPGYGGNPG
jgi:hypothetical protein